MAIELGIRSVICGRLKSMASISTKMSRTGRGVDEILDMVGIRVITAETEDCYRLATQIADELSVVPNQYDDYIAEPKANGYQSIHTTVLGDEGVAVEIQIRTPSMHAISERGSAKRETHRIA